MPDMLNAAKGAMTKASNFTKSVEGTPTSRFAVKAKPTATPMAVPAKAAPGLGAELGAKAANVTQFANAPKMHDGGMVPGKKGEEVPIIAKAGEKITPAENDKPAGRQSEYRKVFIARQQKRGGGGNKPVTETPEKHDQKKAEKSGQPSAKEAGAHVKA
jgi:hypothetical protein